MVKVGVIGAGGIARQHVAALMDTPGGRTVTVADIDRSRAEALAVDCGAEAATDYREAIDGVDAVYVCTPPTLHRQHILAAAEAGRAIFTEKPLATTLEDGEAICDGIEAHGARCMVGFCMRFREPFRRLKAIYDSGDLGEPISYWTTRMSPSTPDPSNWRATPGMLCGITIESASHDIDLLRWMGGDVASVAAKIACSQPDIPGFDDNLNALLNLESRCAASFTISWSGHVGWNSRGVIGAKGSACVEGPGMWALTRLRWRTDESGGEQVEEFAEAEAADMGYLAENRRFIDCVETGAPMPVTEADGLAALRVSLAMHEASETGRIIEVT